MADMADLVLGIIVDNTAKNIGSSTLEYKVVGLKGLNLLNLELVDLPKYKDNFFSVKNNPDSFNIVHSDTIGISSNTFKMSYCNLNGIITNSKISDRCIPIYDLHGNIVNRGDSMLGFLECSPCIGCCIDINKLSIVDMYVSKDIGNKPPNGFRHLSPTYSVDGTTIDGIFSKIYTNSYEYGELLYFKEDNIEEFIAPKEYSVFYTERNRKLSIKTLVLHSGVERVEFGKGVLNKLESLYISEDSSKKLISSILFSYLSSFKVNSIDYDILCDRINKLIDVKKEEKIYDLCMLGNYKEIVAKALESVNIVVY